MVQNDYILKGKKKANFITLLFLIIIVLISYLLCTFVISIYIIQENSMYPTLKNNNYIFVEKVSKYFSIKQEDIIIFNNDGRTLIKRVIAVPGDKIEIYSNKIVVNGDVIDKKINSNDDSYYFSIVIPDQEYFVMGDNRLESADSREFGPISKNDIDGKILFVIW